MKTFNEFVNEGIRDKMRGPSEKELESAKPSIIKWISNIVRVNDGCITVDILEADISPVYKTESDGSEIHEIEALYLDDIAVLVREEDDVNDKYRVKYVDLNVMMLIKIKNMLEVGLKNSNIDYDFEEDDIDLDDDDILYFPVNED